MLLLCVLWLFLMQSLHIDLKVCFNNWQNCRVMNEGSDEFCTPLASRSVYAWHYFCRMTSLFLKNV
jgi:hypothetical protein